MIVPLAAHLGRRFILPLVLSIAGLGNDALRQRLADGQGGRVLDESLAYCAGTVQQRPASSVQIARVLSDYFNLSIRAEQFVGTRHFYREARRRGRCTAW